MLHIRGRLKLELRKQVRAQAGAWVREAIGGQRSEVRARAERILTSDLRSLTSPHATSRHEENEDRSYNRDSMNPLTSDF